MDIIFRSRRTNIPERFREHAEGKLVKIEKLDQKAISIDVEVSNERNPRQSGRRERVELTIYSRGPVIRAEASAEDRYAALDMAFAKLENRLRRACDRRKGRHAAEREMVRYGSVTDAIAAVEPGVLDLEPPDPDTPGAPDALANGSAPSRPQTGQTQAGQTQAGPTRERRDEARLDGELDGREAAAAHLVPIQMEGDCPVVVREKMHRAEPMSIEQALLEMELVGHDFFLFHDRDCDRFSVVYRRRGYDYGVIRLMETSV